MYLSRVRVRCMPPFDASASHFNCTLLVLLCKYLSNYFLLNHLTHPHLESNLVLTLSYSISDVLVCVRVRCMPPFDTSASHFNCTLLVLLCKYLSNYFLLHHFTLFYQHDWHIKEYWGCPHVEVCSTIHILFIVNVLGKQRYTYPFLFHSRCTSSSLCALCALSPP